MAYLALCVWECFFCEAGCQKLRDAFVGSQSLLGDAYRALLEMVLGFPQRYPWRWDYAVHQRGSRLSLSLESYACKYGDLTFKIRVKKKSRVSPFTNVMVLCHLSGKEAAGLAPLVRAHRCWHQLCSAPGQQAPRLPVCGVKSK